MDVIEAIETRKTKRSFKPDPVPKETILKILEAANNTPSTGNTQPWQIYVAGRPLLDNVYQALLKKFENGITHGQAEIPLPKEWPPAMQERYNQMHEERGKAQGIEHETEDSFKKFVHLISNSCGAPVLIVVCMDRSLETWSVFSLGMLTQNILLSAHNFGLSSFPGLSLVSHAEIIRKELKIPDDLKIVFGIAIGYPDDDPINNYRSSRRPIEEVATFL